MLWANRVRLSIAVSEKCRRHAPPYPKNRPSNDTAGSGSGCGVADGRGGGVVGLMDRAVVVSAHCSAGWDSPAGCSGNELSQLISNFIRTKIIMPRFTTRFFEFASYPKPAAAIVLGSGVRRGILGYLESSLLVLKDVLAAARRYSDIRSLVGEISQIYRERESERYQNDQDFQKNLDNQLHHIKLPALVAYVDQSSLPKGGYRRLYGLGIAWGECIANETERDPTTVLRCCDRFADACRNLSDAERNASHRANCG